MARLTWSSPARRRLAAIAEHIAKDSPQGARIVLRKIDAVARQAALYPRSGRIIPELANDDFREVFAFRYRVMYAIRGDEVLITDVIHGAQDWKPEV